jgi:hypothetical protein
VKKGSSFETFEGVEPNLPTHAATVTYGGIGHFHKMFRGTESCAGFSRIPQTPRGYRPKNQNEPEKCCIINTIVQKRTRNEPERTRDRHGTCGASPLECAQPLRMAKNEPETDPNEPETARQGSTPTIYRVTRFVTTSPRGSDRLVSTRSWEPSRRQFKAAGEREI